VLVLVASNALASSPPVFLWQLQVKEWHPQGIDFAQGLYYFDYSCSPTFCTRQENNMLFSAWRTDLPFNIFYGFNASLVVEYLDNESGQVVQKPIGSFANSFWPADYLHSSCVMKSANATLAREFSGRFNDCKSGLLMYTCSILQNPNVTAFTTPAGSLVRLVVGKQLPMWEPQVWDVISETIYDAPFPKSFLAPRSLK
jgi:hypothetical protein